MHSGFGRSFRCIIVNGLLVAFLAFNPSLALAYPYRDFFVEGEFDVSLGDGTFVASGPTGGRVGIAGYDMSLILTESSDGPLCRVVTGDLTFTSTAGHELFAIVSGGMCYGQNHDVISTHAKILYVGGTGRFTGASGTGAFNLGGQLDTSGVHGNIYSFHVVSTIIPGRHSE